MNLRLGSVGLVAIVLFSFAGGAIAQPRPAPFASSAFDGLCRWTADEPAPSEGPTQYYKRSVLPQQIATNLNRLFSTNAIDVDCMVHAYSAGELADYAIRGDMVAQYATALTLLRTGCTDADVAIGYLAKVSDYVDADFAQRSPRLGEMSVPESGFYASFAEYECHANVEVALTLAARSYQGGYDPAEVATVHFSRIRAGLGD